MAFARHNIEKHRLIELVRMNPILWDCRLPHYKRSDKIKDIKWCELGRAFNVSGERVQRTFTSLREIFRRELNHEKLLGEKFTSKWEYYGAMSFLKDVIRERKTRDRFKKPHNGRSKDELDEYGYYPSRSNENCLNLQPDIIMNDSPSAPENCSSRSTMSSMSIKEELSDQDGDDECNDESPKLHNLRKRPQVIKSKINQAGSVTDKTAFTCDNQRQTKNIDTKTKISEEEEEDSSTRIRQTPREILYTKFGEFLSARLNTLNETAANDLMNQILLLIAENR